MSEQIQQFPDKIEYEVWYKPGNGCWFRRDSLEWDHPENVYNHIKTKYPGINPEDYGVRNPEFEKFYKDLADKTRKDLEDELIDLRKQIYYLTKNGII